MSATVRAASGIAQNGTSQGIAETSANPQAGDLRIVFLTVVATTTITLPSGWTALYSGAVGGYTMAVATKPWVAGVGTETFSWGTNYYCDIELASVTGWKTGASPTLTTNGGTSSTTLTATGLTPGSADELVLAYFAVGVGTGASTTTLSPPAGMTQATTHAPATAAGVIGSLSSVAAVGGGAVGNKVSTASQAGVWRSALVSIPSAGTASSGGGNFFPYLGLGAGVAR